MGQVQFIDTPSGRLAVLSEEDYRLLAEAAEDNADAAAIADFRRRLAAGEEELIPAEFVNRMLDGENPIRVWRDCRGMTASQLAENVGISQDFLSQLENGKRDPSVVVLKAIAAALRVDLDDVAP
ncbi:hypothetical protein STAQ_37440 [Allostella sp. ATCC 35155]|nr:hypothetical protein STAQ_37440 [Stella sp. ATCC 35155]